MNLVFSFLESYKSIIILFIIVGFSLLIVKASKKFFSSLKPPKNLKKIWIYSTIITFATAGTLILILQLLSDFLAKVFAFSGLFLSAVGAFLLASAVVRMNYDADLKSIVIDEPEDTSRSEILGIILFIFGFILQAAGNFQLFFF